MAKKLNIPNLQPQEFDDFLFGDWKPTVQGIYSRFHIARIEDYKNFITLPVLPHRRSIYFFFYVTQGRAVRSKNLNRYEVRENDFYCLPAFQITSLEAMSKDIKGFYCHFEPEIFNQSQLNVKIEQDFPFFSIMAEPLVKIISVDRIGQQLELLYTEYNHNEMQREKIIALHLTTLLNEVNFDYSERPSSPSSAASILTQRYKNALSEHIGQLKRVVDGAHILGVTPNHLNKSVKKVTGKSAHELLVHMRVLQAKVWLKQTDLQIKEIAYKLGEFESSDFSKFFKKVTGQTPIEYRNEKR